MDMILKDLFRIIGIKCKLIVFNPQHNYTRNITSRKCLVLDALIKMWHQRFLFIKINLDEYISRLESKGKQDHLENLKKLQDEGIETLIKVVEIKSDEEQDEATPAKEEYAKAHFERVNRKLD